MRAHLPQSTAIEIWFQDEARVGQKNKITRRWAKRGTRPSAPHDQRTKSAYIFGAICPALGKGAGLVLPVCNTDAMNLHLAEIARTVAPGAHAVLLMDQAGWHMTAALIIPENISIIPLPAKCPELNPVENIRRPAGDCEAICRKEGSSCEITGSPTASSNPMMRLLIIAVTLGTS